MLQIKNAQDEVIFTQNNFTYQGEFMGERSVSCTAISPTVLPFSANSYIDYRSERFKLYKTPLPTVKKKSSSESIQDAFTYELKFLSQAFELQLCQFRDVITVSTNDYYENTSNVEFTGDASYLRDRIQSCLDEMYFGAEKWTINLAPNLVTEQVDISGSDISCWDALALFNSTEKWKLNFVINGKTITVGSAGEILPITFEYGKGNGLYSIDRIAVDSESIITRLRVYGSDRNIPENYKRECVGRVAPDFQYQNQLMLPAYASINGAAINAVNKGIWGLGLSYVIGDLVKYSDGKRYYCTANAAIGILPTNTSYFTPWPNDYIESETGIALYGIREGVFRDETIFPSLKEITGELLVAAGIQSTATGRVDEIIACSVVPNDTQSYFYVFIKDIGFNINEHLVAGESAILSLIDSPTGLGGTEFQITSVVAPSSAELILFPSAKYRLTLNVNQDDKFNIPNTKSGIYPSDNGAGYLIPSYGGMAHFVLLNINMPLAYVLSSEQKLLTSGKSYLAKNDHPKVSYAVGVDEIQMARLGGSGLDVGANTTLHPRWNDSGDVAIYGTDRFGFGALPSGFRNSDGGYYEIGDTLPLGSASLSNGIYWFHAQIQNAFSFINAGFFGDKNHGVPILAVRPATTEEQILPDGAISATAIFDGDVYQCTKIGLQVWTTTALKVNHYADGTPIPTNLSDAAWAADTDGACAVYGKNDGAFVSTDELTTEALMVAAYGRLYNWYAVDNAHGLIDTTDGWHVHTDVEFTQLTDYLISTYPYITIDNVGDALKSVRQVNSPYKKQFEDGKLPIYEGCLMGTYDPDLGIGTSKEDPQYIIIQSLTIKEGFSRIPTYDVTLSDTPVASTLGAIKNDVKKVQDITVKNAKLNEAITDRLSKTINGIDWITQAMASGETSALGGLLLTNLLFMRDIDGNITGGLSGLRGDGILDWGGGSYDGALRSLLEPLGVAYVDREDGSGHKAFGNLKWDSAGNLTLKGIIGATGGTFGGLTMSGTTLFSPSMEFGETDVESLDFLKTPVTVSISRQPSWYNYEPSDTNGDVWHEAYTQNIVLVNSAVINFAITAKWHFSDGSTSYVAYIKDELTNLEYVVSAGTFTYVGINSKLNLSKFVPAGTYSIRLKAISSNSIRLNELKIYGVQNEDFISIVSYNAKTKIGRNGFYSFWDSDNYLYYSNTYGYETRVGSYGQQITEAGIKSWNGSEWVGQLENGNGLLCAMTLDPINPANSSLVRSSSTVKAIGVSYNGGDDIFTVVLYADLAKTQIVNPNRSTDYFVVGLNDSNRGFSQFMGTTNISINISGGDSYAYVKYFRI